MNYINKSDLLINENEIIIKNILKILQIRLSVPDF
jgi:hypothetical protein